MSGQGISTKSYSGSDFTIRAYVDLRDALPEGMRISELLQEVQKSKVLNSKISAETIKKLRESEAIIPFADVQTISSSSAASISQVMNIGSSTPGGITKGPQIFAGSIVFTLFDSDPLIDLYNISSLFSTDNNSNFISISQVPRFHIGIEGSHEVVSRLDMDSLPLFSDAEIHSQNTIHKLIYGIVLSQYGETISIDDFFTEQIYQYACEWVSPWSKGVMNISDYLVKKTDTSSVFHQVESIEDASYKNYITARLRGLA